MPSVAAVHQPALPAGSVAARPRGAGGRRPRVALFGHFGVGNLGNEGSLDAMTLIVRQRFPDAEITVVCSSPEAVSARTGLNAVAWTRPELSNPILRLLNGALLKLPYKLLGPIRAWRILRAFDVVIVPGTGLLDDFGERPEGVPYVILKWVLAARLSGRPFLMACIGAGPIRRRLSRFLMMSAARMTTYLSFRDQASRLFVAEHVARAGASKVYPDIAFSLPVSLPSKEARTTKPLIAVGVMHYRGWSNDDGRIYQRYIARLAEAVATLIGRGHRIRLVIGEDGDATAVADLRAQIADRLGPAVVADIEYAPARNLFEVIQQFSGAEAAVVTRFHNLVCALLAGTAVASLSYGAKNDLLLEDLGLDDVTAHVERFDSAWVVERIEALRASRFAYANRIAPQLAAYRRALEDQARELHALISEAATKAEAIVDHEAESRP
jgi:polysaccharide pyruvyl transferase WcaK-like protein